MSYISDYIAQRRLDLQVQSQSLSERKFATEQANFNRKLQADFENEQEEMKPIFKLPKFKPKIVWKLWRYKAY